MLFSQSPETSHHVNNDGSKEGKKHESAKTDSAHIRPTFTLRNCPILEATCLYCQTHCWASIPGKQHDWQHFKRNHRFLLVVDSDAFSTKTLTWENSKMNNINTLYFRDAITVASGEKTWMKTGSTHRRVINK